MVKKILWRCINLKMTKSQILEQSKNVKSYPEMINGFTCIGTISHVYPELPQDVLDYYRVWIWEWYDKSFRIATEDFGGGRCVFICEGNPTELIKHVPSKCKSNIRKFN